MSDYAILFDVDNKTYRLPVNPEKMEYSHSMKIDKKNVLGLGEIAVLSDVNLRMVSFEAELPWRPYEYVETKEGFLTADEYITFFQSLQREKKIFLYIHNNGLSDQICMPAMLQEFTVTERAGEEGDKYVSFQITECVEAEKVLLKKRKRKSGRKSVAKKPVKKKENPRKPSVYVVAKGDSLYKIAKALYGDGSQWKKIWEANKDKIKNANLIYPGQKLRIP